MGGLGNQLFQYNFALFLKEKFPNVKIILNISYFKKDSIHGGYLLPQKDFKISKNVYRLKSKYFLCTDNSNINEIDPNKNIMFYGYWQDPKIMGKYTVKIEDLFKIKLNNKNNDYYNQIIKSKNSVSIHIRCGDYNNNYMHGNIATKSFFQNAINYISEKLDNPVFFVFSDDVEWCKKNIDFGKYKNTYIIGNEKPDAIQYDIFLMSKCHHNIISNSSFSWWGQYYNEYNDKIVISPSYWLNQKNEAYNCCITQLQNIKNITYVPNVPICNTSNENPFFTIIILAYNQEDCIKRAITSILNQEFNYFEIIIVNDGSTDGTLKVLNEYKKLNKKIKIINNEINKSRYTSRKSGVKEASGKWILFLDGDDYFMPDTLKELYDEILKDENYDAYEFNYIERPSKKIYKQIQTNAKDRFEEWFKKNNLSPTIWNKAYNSEKIKEAFENMHEYYINLYEDTCESIIISYYCRNIKQLNFIGINYLNLNDGISTELKNYNKNIKAIDNTLLVFNELNDFLIEKKLNTKYSLDIIYHKILTHLFDNIEFNTENSEIMSSFNYSFKVLQDAKELYKERNKFPINIYKKIKKFIKIILKKIKNKYKQLFFDHKLI